MFQWIACGAYVGEIDYHFKGVENSYGPAPGLLYTFYADLKTLTAASWHDYIGAIVETLSNGRPLPAADIGWFVVSFITPKNILKIEDTIDNLVNRVVNLHKLPHVSINRRQNLVWFTLLRLTMELDERMRIYLRVIFHQIHGSLDDPNFLPNSLRAAELLQRAIKEKMDWGYFGDECLEMMIPRSFDRTPHPY